MDTERLAPPPRNLECGGKRSATPLWEASCATESGVAAPLCVVANRANADAVKADFGNKTQGEDPVIHFYQHFLDAYDKQKRIQRGVFYTPQPVVSYIVRSVHELLQTEFGIEDGLASTVTWADMLKRHPELKLPKVRAPKAGKAEGEEVDLSPDEFFVMILDIATGTGTFLDETVEVSPGYRSRYAEFLKIAFPRLPLTGNLELFRALARLGGDLVALHLLESPKLDKPITEYIGGRSPEVEKVSWSKNTVWLDKAQTTGFKGVREDVWNFHIGGYQVCEKWLKDRKGRNLTADDRTHYQKIVVALSQTIRLMAEIDAVIAKHGGWPLK